MWVVNTERYFKITVAAFYTQIMAAEYRKLAVNYKYLGMARAAMP